MATTTYSTLGTLLAPFSRKAASTLRNAETQKEDRAVALTADTGTSDVSLYYSDGPSYVLGIDFVPDIAIASSATEKVVLGFFNAGTDGLGTTSIGTYSTYASDSSTINAALVQYVKKAVYAPTNPLYCAANTVLRVDVDVTTGSSIELRGKFSVRYVPIVQ